MFDLLHDVEIKAQVGDTIEGIVTAQPSWVRPYYGSQKGALAVRSESLYGFMDWLEATRHETRNYYAIKSSDKPSDNGWQYFNSLDECVRTYRNEPWKVRTFEPTDVPLRFSENVGNQVEYDVTGDYIDMGRYLEGEPECWGHNVMGNPQGLFAKIVLNISASAYIDGEVLRRRGQRVTRLVDWLESQHIRTEIVALKANECMYAEVVIKRFDEALNLDSVAVAGHSDFLRRLMFRVAEMSQTWVQGHGSACTINQGTLQLPPIESNGMLIFSENQRYTEEIDRNFDTLEKEIEKALEDGDRYFRKAV